MLLSSRIKKRLADLSPEEEEVIGVVLGSGKVVSLSLISPGYKIFSSNFQGRQLRFGFLEGVSYIFF